MAERKDGALGRLSAFEHQFPALPALPKKCMKHVCVEDAGKFHFLPYQ